MSQTAAVQQNVSVPPAFRRAPEFKSQFDPAPAVPESATPSVAVTPEAPQPVVEPMRIPAPAARHTSLLPPVAHPTEVAGTPPTAAPVPPTGDAGQSAQPTGDPAPAGVPDTAAPRSEEKALQHQLAMERAAYAQREQQWMQAMQVQQEQLQAAQQAQQELENYKRQAELQQQLSSEELYNGLETVDAADARRIAQVAANAYQPQLEAMRQQLEQQSKAFQQAQAYTQQQMAALQSKRTREELLTAHPDFFQLYETPAFKQFLSQRDGLSSRTREERAMEEYNAGNAAYVIDMINTYKGVVPRVENMQQVAPVQVASAATAAAPAMPTQPQDTLADLNNLMQTRQITPDEYRVRLNALRAAQSQRPV